MTRTSVLIVGAGPVGLALSGDLAWRGIDNVVVERTDGTITQPKMDLIGPRTMEFCRRWGIEQAVRDCPYNPDHPQDNAWVESMIGHEFGREIFAPPREAVGPPQSPVRRERCPQDMFDPILRRWVDSMPAATLRFETEMIAFSETPETVSVTIRTPDSGEEVIEAGYLVGCDGGSSGVRQALGIPMRGNPALTYTTNVVFRAPRFWDLHDKRKGYRFIFIGPEGTWATLVAIDGYDRFRFSIIGDDVPRALGHAEVATHIRRAMGRDFAFEILSIVPWVRRELVADSYGAGRVYIAGDACHLNSPTGAFGMNTGMQDAVDLSWKLDAVISGWGGPRLLASYEAERRPVAIRNVAEASENLRRMLSPRDLLTPAVFQPGREGDLARCDFGHAFTATMKREWFTLHIHLGYIYEKSPIILPDGSPPPDDPVMTYLQTARPGSRAPHAWTSPGHSTLDLFGRGYVLMRFDSNVEISACIEAASARHVPLSIVDIENPDVAALYVHKLVLVRPDGFVAWRGEEWPNTPQIFDIVRGLSQAPA